MYGLGECSTYQVCELQNTVAWETHKEQNPPMFRRSQMVIRVIVGISNIVICERTVLKKMNIGKS